MFRQASTVALNDIAVACREAADFYRDGAEQLSGGKLGKAFLDLAEAREQVAEELSNHIQALSELPQTPDTDKLQIQKIIRRIRTTFANNERLVLIDERIHAENHLDSLTVIALAEDLQESTRSYLHELRDDIQTAQRRLTELKTQA